MQIMQNNTTENFRQQSAHFSHRKIYKINILHGCNHLQATQNTFDDISISIGFDGIFYLQVTNVKRENQPRDGTRSE
jgi:hypothetical protein